MDPPEFHETVEPLHRRIDPDDWRNLYVVGDVHGCLRELEALLEELDPGEEDLLVFVGDLVRKGPNSERVVDLVRSAPNMVSVRGNNEQKLIDGDKTVPELDDDDLDWMASMPVAVSWPGHLVVHGGIDPRKRLDEHTVEDLVTVRSLAPGGSYDPPYWFERYEGPPRVFFGHTVLEEPIIGEHVVGLDTGCVYGGELSAYDCTRHRVVSVDLDRTVKERPDEKFVAPPAGLDAA